MTAALCAVCLLLGRSADRAGLGASAAFDADFGIDFILAVAFADRGNGTFSGTGTAADAFTGNFVSHRTSSSSCSRVYVRICLNYSIEYTENQYIICPD